MVPLTYRERLILNGNVIFWFRLKRYLMQIEFGWSFLLLLYFSEKIIFHFCLTPKLPYCLPELIFDLKDH